MRGLLGWVRFIGMLLLAGLALISCTSSVTTGTAPAATPRPQTPIRPTTLASPSIGPLSSRSQLTTFAGTTTASVTTGANGQVYVVLGQGDALFVTRSTDVGRTFSPLVRATADVPALVNVYERPTLVADMHGRVGVAWVEQASPSIWYNHSDDGGQSFASPRLIAHPEHVETTMVRMGSGTNQHLVAAWLQGESMQIGRSLDGGGSFMPAQIVDSNVCDCCQPHPVVSKNRILIAYRNVERDATGRQSRDIYIAASDDGGETFVEPVRVSDAPWYLEACPISGPAIAADDAHVYVAWMDGRNDTDHSGNRSDIWLAVSTDQAQHFAPNVRVNPLEGHYNNLPVLAIGPQGRLHLSWEADEGERQVIYYTTSNDHGKTFAPVEVIVHSDDGTERGQPRSVAVAVDGQANVYLAWVDKLGAHVLVWPDR